MLTGQPAASTRSRLVDAGGRVAGAFASALLNTLVPPLCQGCRKPLAEPHALCGDCWRALELITPPLCPIMGTPLAFDAGPDARSPELRWNHPLYDCARAAAVFGPMSQRLVHQLKYQDVPGVAPLMARLMLPRIGEIATDADLIVPVPLHRMRLAKRRFNQAALLAAALAPDLGLPWTPFALQRARRTPQQVGLSRDERADNLHNAFRVVHPGDINGRIILVVDDVLTTGATADAIALALKSAGAAGVRIGVFARVVGTEREPT